MTFDDHLKFIQLAKFWGELNSPDTTKVGAVIVAPDGRVLSLGYNHIPKNIVEYPLSPLDKELKYTYTIHAEEHAINSTNESLVGASIYVWPTFIIPATCHLCAKLIAQRGIRKVYFLNIEDEVRKDWHDSACAAASIYKAYNIETIAINTDKKRLDKK